jgi:hypothetical protein
MGTKLGLYEILASLGAGGMDEVYHAREAMMSRDAAIKVCEQFRQELEPRCGHQGLRTIQAGALRGKMRLRII